jgi:hypothetical protein
MNIGNMTFRSAFATRVRANIRTLRRPLPDEAVCQRCVATNDQRVPV